MSCRNVPIWFYLLQHAPFYNIRNVIIDI